MVPRRGLPDPMYGSARPAPVLFHSTRFEERVDRRGHRTHPDRRVFERSAMRPKRSALGSSRIMRATNCAASTPPQSLGARYRHVVEQLANDAGLAAAYLGLGRRGFGVHGDKRLRAAADFFLRRSPGPTYCSHRHQFVSSPALSHAFFQRLIALSIGSPGATRTSLTTAPASRHRSHRTMAVRTPPESPRTLRRAY